VLKSAGILVANNGPAVLSARKKSGLGEARGSARGRPWPLALVDQVMVGGANFITILLLGRLVGADSLGLFALVMTVYYLVLAVQESLITVPYTIFGARLKNVRHLQYSGAALCQSATWAVCVGTILAIVALSMFMLEEYTGLVPVVAAFALVAPIWLIREFGRRYLFAHMQVTKVVAMSVAGATTQIVALCVFGYLGLLSTATALCAMGLGSSVAGFGWLWFSRRAFRFDRRRFGYYLLKNWVLGRWVLACQATAVVAANVMPWLIAIWLGATATGIFAACESIIRFANPMIISLTNVLVPQASISFADGGKPALRRVVWKATALLSLFLLAFCLLLLIAGKSILARSFGSEYAAYAATLVVLGINQLWTRIALAPGQALILLERANIILWAEIMGFATSLVAAAVLFPKYGVLGAALSLLAGNLPYTVITVGAYLTLIRGEGKHRLSIGNATSCPAAVGGVSE
jgi:O-antigen/teichoic acid export membrane protein